MTDIEELRDKTLLQHLKTTLETNIWAWLAKHNIGDPLNRLVFVSKYSPHRGKK